MQISFSHPMTGGWTDWEQAPVAPYCTTCNDGSSFTIPFLGMDDGPEMSFLTDDDCVGHVSLCSGCSKPNFQWASR